jgi:ATP-binding cassette, subfamily B (MDR/TAP), member 1
VLESGKHDELLSKEDGAYTRLVIAQRLRETREVTDLDEVIGQPSEKAIVDHADVEKAAVEEEEIPLGRKNTHRSLASEILEQRQGQGSEKREKEYSLFYLFKRMGRINKGEWKKYLLGCISFIGQYPPGFFG